MEKKIEEIIELVWNATGEGWNGDFMPQRVWRSKKQFKDTRPHFLL